MTQKFTAEEVLAEAQYVRAYLSNNPGTKSDWERNADMLTAYAERIEADERAVPADSGRVGDERYAAMGRAFRDVLSDPDKAWRDTGAKEFIDRVGWKTAAIEAALAAQGQGEAVAQDESYCERGDCPCRMEISDCRHRKIRNAPPASPAGVPDVHGWSLKVQRSDLDGELGIWAVAPGCATWIAAVPSAPEFTTPDCPNCGCVDDGKCLCAPSATPEGGEVQP